MSQSTEGATGFYSIHANRLEDLRDLVLKICSTDPLPPLHNEMCLVQSNGIAQWLKLGLAQSPENGGLGIAAGFNFSLPSTFIWRAYRAILSTDAVPEQSSLDQDVLIWRLYRLLETIVHEDIFAPLHKFLQGDSPEIRRFQLAQRIALLFDQYQVYRADWLAAWEANNDVMFKQGASVPVPEQYLWQAHLWRVLVKDAGEAQSVSSRANVHERFMQRAKALDKPVNPHLLPKRIIVFGISAMPQQILEALQAVSKFTRVIFCVANPCQYYWGDIVSQRDIILSSKKAQKRQRARQDERAQLAALDIEDLHQQANPLLASLGKQGRDYIRLLEECDGTYADEAAHEHLANDRINVFTPYAHANEQGYVSVLNQIQNDIFDLTPIDELIAAKRVLKPRQDNSLVFHQVHSAQREVEVLHDQLLDAFNKDPSLQPSDVLVMTPDINKYAPHINAVFALYDKNDTRHIPFTISDQGLRDQDPNVIALEHLLSLDKSRFTYTEILSLLELPAIREKFALSVSELDVIKRWSQGTNIRWGLDAQHRNQFVSTKGLHLSTWQAGLRSMLLGYAMPASEQWAGEVAYADVGGLEVKVIGPLIEFIDALRNFKCILDTTHTAAQWQGHIQNMLDAFFSDTEISTLAIKSELAKQCEKLVDNLAQANASDEQLPISTIKDLLLNGLDSASSNHRFLMGSVNFATLMPMRAIPFKRLYILGMNDGDFPRHNKPIDFDLMASDYRPGDRSMREDDRYLFLEALLAARESLYISWVGRSIKDDAQRPPSLLVSQLMDYVNKFWHLPESTSADEQSEIDALRDKVSPSDTLTSAHPLQAFSEKYFTAPNCATASATLAAYQAPELFTYAREWREALIDKQQDSDTSTQVSSPQASVDMAPGDITIDFIAPEGALALDVLSRFLKKPVETFFKQALMINFDSAKSTDFDREVFTLNNLDNYSVVSDVIDRAILPARGHNELASNIEHALERMQAMGAFGLASTAQATSYGFAQQMQSLGRRYVNAQVGMQRLPYDMLNVQLPIEISDEILINVEGSFGDFWQNDAGERVRLLVCKSDTLGSKSEAMELVQSKQDDDVNDSQNKPKPILKLRYENLLKLWIEHLAGHAVGEDEERVAFTTMALAKDQDCCFVFKPLSHRDALAHLHEVLHIWYQGMQRPLRYEGRAGAEWAGEIAMAPDLDEQARLTLKQNINSRLANRLSMDEGYYRRAFGDEIDISVSLEFEHLAERIYLPLIQAVEIICHD
ncbi:exodeoxyribonuclease V subunit gamma [Glaciecola siphonariae]|uniref:RecBCD enzyme subunit RecC n=1 Tax=Glaciecola siphonariae TaxID=521012 RepID=A0ABV9LXD7_9ALTE